MRGERPKGGTAFAPHISNVSRLRAKRQLAVHVCASGPGIEPELWPCIFERFSRGSLRSDAGSGTNESAAPGVGTGTSEDAEGSKNSGLGLAIVRALVEAQDGAITVKSRPGEGSVFAVTLPRAIAPGQAR